MAEHPASARLGTTIAMVHDEADASALAADWAYIPVPAPRLRFFHAVYRKPVQGAQCAGNGHGSHAGKLGNVGESHFTGTTPFSG
jgi:hypothetical protein